MPIFTRFACCLVLCLAMPTLRAASEPLGQCLMPDDARAQDEFGAVMVTGDFNGDRIEDLAVTAALRAASPGGMDSGSVSVFLRQPDGSLVFDAEFADAQSGADVGDALAAGRLATVDDGVTTIDRDALVIGIPGATVAGHGAAGRVSIRVRGDDGVWRERLVLTQDSPGVPGAVEDDDRFGAALAVGDFDGDDREDLAIGAPTEAIGNVAAAGAVIVLYSEPGGLATQRTLLLHQDLAAMNETAEADDQFGASLAAGDFALGGADELAIGVPREDVVFDATTRPDAGLVHVIPGSPSGLDLTQARWRNAAYFPPAEPTESLRFGETLLMGRFRNEDGGLVGRDVTGDLVIGMPGFSTQTRDQIGLVGIAYRSPDVLFDASEPRQLILASDVAAPGEEFDRFGMALASGAMGRRASGMHTLAIAAPYRRVGVGNEEIGSAGAVYVIEADPDLGLQPDGGRMLQPAPSAPCGEATINTQFGRSVAVLGPSQLVPGDAGIVPGRIAVGGPTWSFDAAGGAEGAVELRETGLFRDGFED